VVVVATSIITSCSTTKYVPKGEYLLKKNKIELNKEDKAGKLTKSEIQGYLRQQPNRSFLGIKAGVMLYNLSNPDKNNKWNNWLRKNGDPPVILDTLEVEKSVKQIKSFVDSRGFFQSVVDDTIDYRKNSKAVVYYRIWSRQAYRIRNITYEVLDSLMRDMILRDTLEAVIRPGMVFKVEDLQKERERIETLCRDSGYYAFSKDYVSFDVDTTIGNHQIDINVVVSKALYQNELMQSIEVLHHKYKIRNVYFFVDFDPQKAIEDRKAYYSGLDTSYMKGFYFVSKRDSGYLKKKVILQANYLFPNTIFNLEDVNLTRKHLIGLNVFKFVNIYFSEVPQPDTTKEIRLIDCHIQLSPITQQSYTVELEGTNSSGNLGGALSFNYQHRNLFHGAENFNIRIKQSIEALAQEERGVKQIMGTDVEANLVFGKFLSPFFNREKFVKKFAPKTTVTTAFNYQRRPDYTRTIFTTQMMYSWQTSRFVSQLVSPFSLNAVKLTYIDPDFLAHLDTTTYLAYSYRDVFISSLNYSYIFSNAKLKKKSDHLFIRFNAETAGNLLYAGYKVTNRPVDSSGSYNIFGLQFAQYIKADIDIRFTNVLNEFGSITYRFFAGAGLPYQNSRALPFERQYYAGGANDIRAWHVRSLGPGSYVEKNSGFYNRTSDMKLEANIEYRFKMFWVLEGALFLDMGNIWAITKEDDRTGALFKFNKFMNDIAVGTGLGARFDFDFFIFRVDLGIKMRDPGIATGNKWIMTKGPLDFHRDLVLQVGIGYPF